MALETPTNLFTHRSETHEYTIYWTTLGDDAKPPLIFIHGTPWSSYVWMLYARSLSSRFKVYVFDNTGFGRSPGGKPLSADNAAVDASLAGQAEAFSALYQSWNFHPDRLPHVVAHDVGGLISLRAHILHACRYASLCLVDVVAVRPFGSPFFRLVSENQAVFNAIPDAVYRGMLGAYIQGAAFKPLASDVAENLSRPWVAGGTQGQEAFIRQISQADERHSEEVEGRYSEVGAATPVKVIWGAEDRWIPVDRADRVSDLVGAKECVVIEDAGHLIMFDQPERLTTEIVAWLSQVAR